MDKIISFQNTKHLDNAYGVVNNHSFYFFFFGSSINSLLIYFSFLSNSFTNSPGALCLISLFWFFDAPWLVISWFIFTYDLYDWYYNVLSQSENDGYIWYEIEEGKYCANITTLFLPKEDNEVEMLRKENEELKKLINEIHKLSGIM